MLASEQRREVEAQQRQATSESSQRGCRSCRQMLEGGQRFPSCSNAISDRPNCRLVRERTSVFIGRNRLDALARIGHRPKVGASEEPKRQEKPVSEQA